MTWVRQNHATLGIVASSVLPLFFYGSWHRDLLVGGLAYFTVALVISLLSSERVTSSGILIVLFWAEGSFVHDNSASLGTVPFFVEALLMSVAAILGAGFVAMVDRTKESHEA